eukprot:scaffold390_cov191-Alexandrium_tamarense.AAC.3
MLRVIYHKIISSHLTDSECWCVVSRYYNPTVRTERKLVQFVLLEVVVEARQESGDNIIDNFGQFEDVGLRRLITFTPLHSTPPAHLASRAIRAPNIDSCSCYAASHRYQGNCRGGHHQRYVVLLGLSEFRCA